MSDREQIHEEVATMEQENNPLLYDVVDELGIISEDTKIVGDVFSKGHLAIAGTINGNVTTKGNVVITGVVKGKIICDNLILKKCVLTTEIDASGQVAIEDGSSVTGRIKCKNITVCGTVNGDIEAAETLVLTKGTLINGNIKAGSIGMEFGARVNGTISMPIA